MQTAESYQDIRLRSNLEISPGEDGTWIIAHPGGERLFRFSDQEYLLATLIHAHSSFEPLDSELFQRTGKRVTPEILAGFIEKLRAFDLLEGPPSAPSRWKQLERLARIPVPLHNPDRTLEKMLPFAQAIFSRQYVFIAILMLGASWALGATQWNSIQEAMKGAGLPPVARIALAWLAFASIGLVHEYGHGLACKYYGGKVPRMGFMLYYLIPAWFCDASDAYRFKRWPRIVVDLAGLYTTGLFGGFALFLLQFPISTGGRFFVAQIVFMSLFASWTNLIPFVKLDGYFLLSDALGIENLRPRALKALSTSIRERRWPDDGKNWFFFFFGAVGSLVSLAMVGVGLKLAFDLIKSLLL